MERGTTYLKAIAAMLFWALTFVLIKDALQTYRPHEIVFLRLALASVVLFTIYAFNKKRQAMRGKDLARIMLVAFCEPFLYFLGEANGMQYVSSTLGSLVISTIPIVSALGAWLVLREKVSVWVIVGLVISFSGVAVMSMGTPDLHATLKGIALLMLAVFAGMTYGLMVRRLTLRFSPLTIVTWQNLFGMIYFLPLFLYYDGAHFIRMEHSPSGLLVIAAMGVFASVLAFLLFTGVIRDLGVIKSNVFTYLIPVFTVVLAYLLRGEKLNMQAIIGLVLTIGGLAISQYPDLRRLKRRLISDQTA
jgi:drug/metabolite transporter (DMT)-like permease